MVCRRRRDRTTTSLRLSTRFLSAACLFAPGSSVSPIRLIDDQSSYGICVKSFGALEGKKGTAVGTLPRGASLADHLGRNILFLGSPSSFVSSPILDRLKSYTPTKTSYSFTNRRVRIGFEYYEALLPNTLGLASYRKTKLCTLESIPTLPVSGSFISRRQERKGSYQGRTTHTHLIVFFVDCYSASSQTNTSSNQQSNQQTGQSALSSASPTMPVIIQSQQQSNPATPSEHIAGGSEFDGEGASTGEGASSEGGASCTSPPDGKDDKTKKKNRCAVCRKKLGLTGFECRCGGQYCAVHRYSDKHNCTFDYRELGAQEIRRNNPVVVGEKIHKI
ncbi:unnamed protein product [Nezara viridula]|uniref:AN1-type domain-containing protein n=1 Tax=Nezara viridula TaxID=85310 RepID=A0A9P0MTN5_NEZVI|nr:unnamed protein product [Nezara viridula]